MAKLLGFQLANKSGENIQGDDDDPTSLASFEIMSPTVAVKVIADLPGFLLQPIFEGDLEEPSIITS